jgi:hypothetical protein
MKLLKNITLFVAAAAIMTACSKYEEGPKFSLRTKKARITNEWVVEEVTYTQGGTTADITSDYKELAGDYVLEIEKDGVYRTEGNYPDKGTWDMGEDGDDLYLQSDEPNSDEESFRITRLKSKELWMKQTQENGDVVYFKFKSKD